VAAKLRVDECEVRSLSYIGFVLSGVFISNPIPFPLCRETLFRYWQYVLVFYLYDISGTGQLDEVVMTYERRPRQRAVTDVFAVVRRRHQRRLASKHAI